MAKEKKFETHYLKTAGDWPACIKNVATDPQAVTCKRCLRKMGLYTSPREARAGRVKRIVDGIMDKIREILP
jgi:hypothetical protein